MNIWKNLNKHFLVVVVKIYEDSNMIMLGIFQSHAKCYYRERVDHHDNQSLPKHIAFEWIVEYEDREEENNDNVSCHKEKNTINKKKTATMKTFGFLEQIIKPNNMDTDMVNEERFIVRFEN